MEILALGAKYAPILAEGIGRRIGEKFVEIPKGNDLQNFIRKCMEGGGEPEISRESYFWGLYIKETMSCPVKKTKTDRIPIWKDL